MDAVLDRALSLRGVTGVLVLTRDSWLTIACRGALTSNDAPTIERLLHWTEEDSTGSIPWLGGEGGRCIHFHRASTHTLILLRQYQQPRTFLGLSPSSPSSPSPATRPRLDSQQSTRSLNLNLNLNLGSFSPRLGLTVPPRMRFGWSRSSTEGRFTDTDNTNDSITITNTNSVHNGIENDLRAGSTSLSLFAPSPSPRHAELAVHDVHRPSSWC